MKKIIGAVVVLFIVIGVTVGVWYHKRFVKIKEFEPAIEKYMPEGEIVFLFRASNFSQEWDRLSASRLGEQVRNIDWKKLEETFGTHSIADKIIEKMKYFISELKVRELIGKNFALAFYKPFSPKEIGDINEISPDDILSAFLIISEPQDEVDLEDVINRIAGSLGISVKEKETTYKDYQINTVKVDLLGLYNLEFSYVEADGKILIGGQDLVREGIDVILGEKDRWVDGEAFENLRKRLPDYDAYLGYFNGEWITDLLMSMEKKYTGRAGYYSSGAYKYKFGYVTKIINDDILSHTVVSYDKDAFGTSFGYLNPVKFHKKDLFLLCPQEPLIFCYMNFAPGKMKDYISKFYNSYNGSAESSYVLEQNKDLINKLFSGLGSQIGYGVFDVKLGSTLLPSVSMAAFIEIKDKKVINEVIKNITRGMENLSRQEDYKNYQITAISIPFTGYQIGYVWLDGYLVVGDVVSLKNIVDVYVGDASSLAQSDIYKSAKVYLRNTPVVYKGFWDINKMIDVGKDLTEFAYNYYVSTHTFFSSSSESENEFLDSLKKNLADKEEALKYWEKRKAEGNVNADEEIKRLNNEIAIIKDRIKYYEKVAQNKAETAYLQYFSPEKVRVIIDEVFYPILEGLRIYRYWVYQGALSVDDDGAYFESDSYINRELSEY